jgi:hypothetical protein
MQFQHQYEENRPARNDEAQMLGQGNKGSNEDNYENRIEIILFPYQCYISSFIIFGRRRRFGLTPAFQDDNQREEDEKGAQDTGEERGPGVPAWQDRELKRDRPYKTTQDNKNSGANIVILSHRCNPRVGESSRNLPDRFPMKKVRVN